MASIVDNPDIDAMFQALKRRAILRGKIKVAQLEIKEAELPIKEASPRNTAARDRASLSLQRMLVQLEVELEDVESTIAYWDFYKDVWKSNQYAINRQLS